MAPALIPVFLSQNPSTEMANFVSRAEVSLAWHVEPPQHRAYHRRVGLVQRRDPLRQALRNTTQHTFNIVNPSPRFILHDYIEKLA